MARPIWTGSISFGLVNIPVKLFTATSPKEVRFHMVHDKDGARIKQKRVCTVDGREVPYEHIAKGYEVSPGHYVVFSQDELEKLDPKTTRTIEIERFVGLDEIDPIYFETTYHLVPDQGAAKAYALLHEAMRQANRVGLARMVLRTKQYLCALRPMESALSVSTMLFADEVIHPASLEGIPDGKPRAAELEMAKKLIDSLSGKFKPEDFKDNYREHLLELIEKKAQGHQVVAQREEAEPRKVLDLMSALKASLGTRGEKRHRPQAARTLKAPRGRKRA